MGVLMDILHKLKRLSDPLVRDFTEAAEEEMIKAAKLNDEEDWFDKNVTDRFCRWLDKNGWLDFIYGVKNYRNNVIDCYNYNAVNIEKICRQARHFDNLYGQTVAICSDQAKNVAFLVKNFAECLNTNSKYYDKNEPISDRIMGFFSDEFDGKEPIEIVRDADQLKEGNLDTHEITEDDITYFCNDPDAENIFDEYNDYVYEQADDWGLKDLVVIGGTLVYKGIEVTIDELIGMLTKEGHMEKVVREQLDKIISSVISADSTTQTFVKDFETAKECIEAQIKEYLEDEDKKSSFKDFVEMMGGITVVKELTEKYPELVDYLFSDYTRGLEIINDISKTCDKSGIVEMRAAVERLREEYESKWKGVLHKFKDFNSDMISELTKKGVEDYIKEEFEDSSIILSVLDIFDAKEKTDGENRKNEEISGFD